jgi:pimeloyl-ACP methyl ester carboxylesterase
MVPFVTARGHRIHYQIIEGGNPPLVLAHGFRASMDDWRQMGYVDALRGQYRLILIDSLGHGLSDRPPDLLEYRPAYMPCGVVAVLDAVGVETTHFMGHSMGGWAGWQMAIRAPGRLRSLIAANSPPQDLSPTPPRHPVLGLFPDPSAVIDPDTAVEPFGMMEALSSLTVPVLVIGGEQDPMFPNIRAAAALIPEADFCSLPGCTHRQAITRIDLVLPQVKRFLQKIESKKRGGQDSGKG